MFRGPVLPFWAPDRDIGTIPIPSMTYRRGRKLVLELNSEAKCELPLPRASVLSGLHVSLLVCFLA